FLQDCGNLQGCSSLLDFVDFHFYATGTSTDQAALAAKLPALSSNLADLRALIDRTMPSRAAQIAIHVGEWNLSYAYNSLDYTGFASAWDADALGRILAAGDVAQAFGTKSGSLSILYHAATGDLAPSGYTEDQPMPIYEALSIFTGAGGLFPRFGTTMASATSTLAGVDPFASSSPDEIVLANTSRRPQDAPVAIPGGGYRSAAEWQINQTGTLPTAPALITSRSPHNGTFYLKLPADSVTTMVITAPASSYKEYMLASS